MRLENFCIQQVSVGMSALHLCCRVVDPDLRSLAKYHVSSPLPRDPARIKPLFC